MATITINFTKGTVSERRGGKTYKSTMKEVFGDLSSGQIVDAIRQGQMERENKPKLPRLSPAQEKVLRDKIYAKDDHLVLNALVHWKTIQAFVNMGLIERQETQFMTVWTLTPLGIETRNHMLDKRQGIITK